MIYKTIDKAKWYFHDLLDYRDISADSLFANNIPNVYLRNVLCMAKPTSTSKVTKFNVHTSEYTIVY